MPLFKFIKTNPKNLFLIDGVGALISAFLLGVVLAKFESFFGIPSPTLYFLAAFPIVFAVYDFWCFVKNQRAIGLFLRIIALANVLYCCLSLGTVIYHQKTITLFGWAYILIEIIIVLTLARFEFRLAHRVL